MKTFLFIINIIFLFFITSCISDKGELASPNNGCDTSYYTMQIKPIIDNNCAISGCHVQGGVGTGNFSTYAGLKPYIDNGSVPTRINLNPNDQFFMPQGGNPLNVDDKAKLDAWIADGYAGCD